MVADYDLMEFGDEHLEYALAFVRLARRLLLQHVSDLFVKSTMNAINKQYHT